MSENYRDTHSLSASEMAQLKASLYWGCCELGNLSAAERSIVENAVFEKDIPDDIVHHAFAEYVFCDEDFIR